MIFSFILFLPFTHSLTCWDECWKSNLSNNDPFADPASSKYFQTCRQLPRVRYCHGRILVYYTNVNHLKFLSYSFGPQEHIIETEIERIADRDHRTYVIYVLFIFDGEKSKNVIITTYVLCQTEDDCAVKLIKDFYEFYRQQGNPIDDFNSFFARERIIRQIICYDYQIHQMIECPPSEYPRCIHHNHFEQGCYSHPNRQIEYAFILTSKNHSIDKRHQLIICDTNHCNNQSMVELIEKMIYRHTIGKMFVINHAGFTGRISLIYLCEFILMITKMIG